MAIQEEYDAIVIGSGEAGKYMAWHLASKGQRVATVEDKQLGGACPNVACLPSKNIIHSAKVASYFRRGAEFGLGHGDVEVDMSKVNGRRKQMVDGLRKVHIANFEKNHAEIIMGFGRFVGENSVQVALNGGGARTLRANHVFIDTGSRATIDPVPGLIESKPLTHVEALELDTVPEHLLILGGGHIGLEFAQAMHRFGSRVTIIERSQALAQWEDPDVSDGIAQLFQDEGIEVLSDTTVTRVEGLSGKSLTLHLKQGTGESTVLGTHLLIATGRTPNTENMGLEVAGINTTPSGHIQVNERLETSAPGVWAMGDCAGSPHFTHISFDDFRIVRDNLAGGQRSTVGR